jgi:type III secretion protein U
VSDHRTEKPTPKRLADARRRGESVQSRDLGGAAALLGGLAGLAVGGPFVVGILARLLSASLASAASARLDARAALHDAAGLALILVLPAAAGSLLAAGAAGLLQAGFLFAPGALRPRLSRVDPLAGAKRLLAPANVAAVGLALVKAAALLGVAAAWLAGASRDLAGLARLDAGGLAAALPLVGGLAVRLGATFALFALADWALARRRHRRALAMTKDEVRREHEEEEGNPAHRAERRRLHRALALAGPVSRATVVVVNPTHLAVALRHEREGDDAPRVIAKGTGLAAARIRSAARRAGVPIVRDVALARALHRLAEVGDEIPEELYDAAAAVLAHLYGTESLP